MAEDNVDRFARGELPAAEARQLGRAALRDPDLFEDLTYASVAKRALFHNRPRNKSWVRFVSLAAAAAITVALVSLGVVRSRRARPGLTPEAASPSPILLARGTNSGAVYRSIEEPSRAPRQSGLVTSIAGRTVTVDVGSLDGLMKNSMVEVVRGGAQVGTVTLATIFRDHARGDAPAGTTIHLNDEVRVPPPLYVRAILDQIAVLLAHGDSAGARRLAGQAAAAGNVDIAAGNVEDLNNLGAIAELRGDRAQAQALYRQALQANPPQEARRIIEANLAQVSGQK